MFDAAFDFTDRHVLVTGGTRGLGLAIAQAFSDSGARVSITGTKIVPTLYDADLSRFRYHQLQLTNSDAIDTFVDRVGHVDVLVNAAAARLGTAMADHEREFVSHSARLGFIGPLRLAHQLRPELTRSTLQGGGAVVHTNSTLRWLELTHTPAEAEAELRAHTSRTGRAWAALNTRVNTVLAPARLAVPHQPRPHLAVINPGRYDDTWAPADPHSAQLGGQRGGHPAGTLLTRPRVTSATTAQLAAAAQVTSVILFLASGAGSAVSGHTIQALPRS